MKSNKENKKLYVLRYVTIKNGIKHYDENNLIKLKQKYPELSYETYFNGNKF